MVGAQIREVRTSRNLSLNEVATRAQISVATLSRIERDKQGLDLGLFLILCRILRAAPHDLLGDNGSDIADPLAMQIAQLTHGDRIQLWHDLASARRTDRKVKSHLSRLADEVEELLAQLEFVRSEIEAVQAHVRRR